jgi:hypothetical protein
VVHRAGLVVSAWTGAEFLDRRRAGGGKGDRRSKSDPLERQPDEQHPRQTMPKVLHACLESSMPSADEAARALYHRRR